MISDEPMPGCCVRHDREIQGVGSALHAEREAFCVLCEMICAVDLAARSRLPCSCLCSHIWILRSLNNELVRHARRPQECYSLAHECAVSLTTRSSGLGRKC